MRSRIKNNSKYITTFALANIWSLTAVNSLSVVANIFVRDSFILIISDLFLILSHC